MKKYFALLICCFGFVFNTNAAFITLDFTATDFENCCTSITTIPQEQVTGSFTFESDTVQGGIINLVSVDLNIDGHQYGLNELGFANFTSSSTIFGLDDLGSILAAGGPDFRIAWSTPGAVFNSSSFFSNSLVFDFAYTTADDFGVWIADSVVGNFSVATSVPEPSSLLLILLCLVFIRMKAK